jgi:UDP-2,3-diacylglucosamine pyrophosphatase LpxH
VPGTLVISDLHLGSRLGHDVLTRPEPLIRLVDAVRASDRLVLLGDAVELAEGRPQSALAIAIPVLRALGAALGRDREVIVVPGNHDRQLVRRWIRRPPAPLTIATAVPLDATPELARVTAALAPAKVRVSYPGVWLDDRTWATHGHYLDQHLMPVSAYGFARGRLRHLPRDESTPVDYERGDRPSLSRLARFAPRPLATLWDDLAELMRASTMPRVRRRLLTRRTAPLTAALLGMQMRRASLPAIARVVHRIGVEAEWVIFGHVHRLGPLAADDPDQWRGPGGTPRLLNTGSWLYEPLLVNRAAPPHPYWPGGAVMLEPGAHPRALGLLDDLPARALR